MIHIPRTQRTYAFSRHHPPAARIAPGETVVFETEDAGSHRIVVEDDIRTYTPRHDYTNPATGPLYIEGAAAGDTLAVRIERIELDAQGYTKISPGAGLLIDEVSAPAAQIWRISGEHGAYAASWRGLSFAAQPMIGTIGVAPAGEPVENYAPGLHGGNLDVPAVAEGATVYLPVFVDGALLGLGDVHARQGDGEISGVALEIRSAVTARIDLLKGVSTEAPWIETDAEWITIGIAGEAKAGMEMATRQMLRLLGRRLDLAPHDALMLLGVAGDMRPGQCMFDPSTPMTFYLTLPRPALQSDKGAPL
jgi:amidase